MAKRKPKSKRQKRRDDPNSALWRNKADRAWSKAIREREDNMCVICGSRVKIQAHHLLDRSLKAWRYEGDNGIALCPIHHKWSSALSAHKGGIAFTQWLQLHRPYLWETAASRADALRRGKKDVQEYTYRDVATLLERETQCSPTA